MAKIPELKTRPLLGTKNDIPLDDPTLLVPTIYGDFLTYDTGGLNLSFIRKRNACTKSEGYTAWSNSAPGSPTKCSGLYELYDGTNRSNLIFESGRLFYYD